MRRMKLVLSVGVVTVAMLIAFSGPAMADDFDCDGFDDEFGFFFDDDDCFFFDDDEDFFFDDDFFDGVDQDVELEAESGDIDQSFDVSGSGSNSNQTVGLDGTANTGNAQNFTGITQIGSDADDFEFDDGGADIDIDSDSSVDSNQRVNQSAASGKSVRR